LRHGHRAQRRAPQRGQHELDGDEARQQAGVGLFGKAGQIEAGAEMKASKYMEWYCAFGLLVTIVWLYLEILRLLSKLNRN